MAKLAAIKDLDKFFAVLKKSDLFSDSQIEEIRDSASDDSRPKDILRTLMKKGELTEWQARQLLVGGYLLMLGRYKLLKQLGSGEASRVYLAEHTQMQREVAMRTLSRSLTSDENTVQRFLSNARSSASLDHPNIMHVFDVDSDKSRYYVVMEYIQGTPLADVVAKENPLPLEDIGDYLSQAIKGLRYAHKKRIIHGNLKPSEILIDEEGVVKILDFGIADPMTNDLKKVAADPYRSPEEARGSQRIDHRSDIYSLGAIAYFMMTGEPPEPAAQRDRKSVLDIRKHRDNPPTELVKIIRKMTAVAREARYQETEDLAEALAAWRDKASKAAAQATSDSASVSSNSDAVPAGDSGGATGPVIITTDSGNGNGKPTAVVAPKIAAQAKPAETPAKTSEAADTDAFNFASAETVRTPEPAGAFDFAATDNHRSPAKAKNSPAKTKETAQKQAAVAPVVATGVAAQPQPLVSSADSSSNAAPAAKPKKQKKKAAAGGKQLPDKKVLIGGAIGGTVLVIGLIVGLVMMLSGGDDTDGLPTDGDTEVAAADADQTDTDDSSDAVGNPSDDIGNPGDDIGNPGEEIGNPGDDIGNPVDAIGNPAGSETTAPVTAVADAGTTATGADNAATPPVDAVATTAVATANANNPPQATADNTKPPASDDKPTPKNGDKPKAG